MTENTIRFHLFIAIMTVTSGCLSTGHELHLPPDEGSERIGWADLREAAGSSRAASNALEASQSSTRPEKAQSSGPRRLCRDDIYARYLKERYSDEDPLRPKLRQARSWSHRRAIERRHDLSAIQYARKRLEGPTLTQAGALPVVSNEKVEFWVRYFKSRGRREFLRWLIRGESMKEVVLPVLKEEGIPVEFFYMAMIESGFKNDAYSHASATGTWQFMEPTAEGYGLDVDYWVDERRDPVKATVAAAGYLKDLYQSLEDWYLTMAAYNGGPSRVRRAIRRTGTRDFWQLSRTRQLAWETRYYVPKIIAALVLARESAQHGFRVRANPEHRLPNTTVTLEKPVKLGELARRLGIDVETLRSWNPELVKNITPPVDNPYQLRLAPFYADRFPQVKDSLSDIKVKDVHIHEVEPGDTIYGIAREYGVDVAAILSLNPSLDAKALQIGREVAVPRPTIVTANKDKKAADDSYL